MSIYEFHRLVSWCDCASNQSLWIQRLILASTVYDARTRAGLLALVAWMERTEVAA